MNTHRIVAQIAKVRELANSLIESELRDRSIVGIVPAHGPVLAFLFQQKKPVPIKAVVAEVGRVKSTVTAMINTLERHGYVRKSGCQTDNRITYVSLTTRGRRFRKEFEDISNLLLERFYGDMKNKDRRELVELLERIENNLKD